MQIEVLTVADCPNRRLALDRLQAAFESLGGPSIPITERVVEDQAGARAAGMHGSPTILIDGCDPFAAATNDASLSCRLFDAEGELEGAPTVDQLVAAISDAVERPDEHGRPAARGSDRRS